MREILLSRDEIVSRIDLKVDNWHYNQNTNCYAFALGLDVKESDIGFNAYQPGIIGGTLKNMTLDEIYKLKLNQRLFLDLEVLGITFEEYDLFKSVGYEKDYLEWKIALFLYVVNNKMQVRSNYHFMRQGADGNWYHKFGFNSVEPNNIDANNNIILNPKTAHFDRYKFFKCYKLRVRKQ